jgi:hypothetical protein
MLPRSAEVAVRAARSTGIPPAITNVAAVTGSSRSAGTTRPARAIASSAPNPIPGVDPRARSIAVRAGEVQGRPLTSTRSSSRRSAW